MSIQRTKLAPGYYKLELNREKNGELEPVNIEEEVKRLRSLIHYFNQLDVVYDGGENKPKIVESPKSA